jgi:hypothetical protein
VSSDIDAIRSQIVELRDKLVDIPTLLEGMRRAQQIERDLRDLQKGVVLARFAQEGEAGYVPKQVLDYGEQCAIPYYKTRWFTPCTDEATQRKSTLRDLFYIEDEVGMFAQSLVIDNCGLSDIVFYLGNFQEEVRRRTRRVVYGSLNEIALGVNNINVALWEMTDLIRKRVKDENSMPLEEIDNND